MCNDIPERNYDFMFDKISITPLTINTVGSGMFYGDEMLGSSDMTIIFDDGSKLELGTSGCGASYGGNYGFPWENYNTTVAERALMYSDTTYISSWDFDKPIDPDTITEIWFGEMRIYNAAEE